MAERDPFGRSADENPLAGLGSLSDGTSSSADTYVAPASSDPTFSASASEPVFSAAPATSKERPADAQPTSKPPPHGSTPSVDASIAEAIRQAQQLSGVDVAGSVRTVRRVVKFAVFFVVVAVIVTAAGSIFSTSKSIRDGIGAIPSADEVVDKVAPPSEAEKAEKAAVPAIGLSSSSMLKRSNFRQAMRRLRGSGLGRMQNMSVRPERIDARLLTKGGSLRSVQIAADDPTEIKQFGAGGSGFSHLETIPFARIDSGAPQRLARGAARRAGSNVNRVDYVVLLSLSGKPTWSGFMKNGKHYLANSHGRITRNIG